MLAFHQRVIFRLPIEHVIVFSGFYLPFCPDKTWSIFPDNPPASQLMNIFCLLLHFLGDCFIFFPSKPL